MQKTSKYRTVKLPAITASDIDRFWGKVDKTPGLGKGECWEWTGALNGGYGAMMFYPPRRTYRATRVAFLIQNGSDPFPLDILHSCNNRKCVRGSHLSAGTPLENVHAAIKDGIFRANRKPAIEKPEPLYDYAARAKPIPPLSERFIEHFLNGIDRTPGQGKNGDCHVWTRCKQKGGYGKIVIDGRRYATSRIAYFIENGVDPGDLQVLHSCDTPACCKKEHLSIGTMRENMTQMQRKGRNAKGDTHGRRVISKAIAIDAQRRYAAGESQQSIANLYGVCKMTINLAIRGKTFKD